LIAKARKSFEKFQEIVKKVYGTRPLGVCKISNYQ
jgi:hypothetical protein